MSTCFSPAGSRTQKPLVILNFGTNVGPGVGKVINQLQGNVLLICGFAFLLLKCISTFKMHFLSHAVRLVRSIVEYSASRF